MKGLIEFCCGEKRRLYGALCTLLCCNQETYGMNAEVTGAGRGFPPGTAVQQRWPFFFSESGCMLVNVIERDEGIKLTIEHFKGLCTYVTISCFTRVLVLPEPD